MSVKSIGVSIVELGVEGTNKYNDLWLRRKVYGEKDSLWSAVDPAIKVTHRGRRTSIGIDAVGEESGHLTFGPYIKLEPGSYRITLTLEGSVLLPRTTFDVTYDCGEPLASVIVEPGARPSPFEVVVEFESKRCLADVEFRTHLDGPMTGHISSFRLTALR